MFKATAGKTLATTITGSLPRPTWFVSNLSGRTFLSAFARDPTYREQYCDAVAALVSDQTRAGLDILSDGEMRFDIDIGGRSWSAYILDRMSGMRPMDPGSVNRVDRGGTHKRRKNPGDILSEAIYSYPEIEGPLSADKLQYDAVWKTAQRLTTRPIKFGSCCAQFLAQSLRDNYFHDSRKAIDAFSSALNDQYHRLADAGCSAIQVEEPSLHNASATRRDLTIMDYVNALNAEVAGLRDKTEVWCHTCWGNPFAQKLTQSSESPRLRDVLSYFDMLNVDVITFETADNGGAELADIAAAISSDKKICIGVVNHRRLQIESPDEVAAMIRKALKVIPPEQLIVSSDCGFGRQGMSRTHAFYKMVAIVLGANMVRTELGLPTADVPAAAQAFALT